MQGIDVHSSFGVMHLYQLLPAPPNWYALFNECGVTLSEPIAAFALIHGPCGRGTRLVGLMGNEKEFLPADCFEGYRETVYRPCSKEAKHCECLDQ